MDAGKKDANDVAAELGKDGLKATLETAAKADATETAKAKTPSQATQLLRIAQAEAELFSSEGDGYAVIGVDSHRETWKVRSAGFRSWLASRLFTETGVAARQGQAMQDALATLEAVALSRKDERYLFSALLRRRLILRVR